MPKPNSISLTDFISNHREDFVAFETWLADDLTNLFIVKNDLNRLHMSIIVDIDEDDPVGKTKDGKLTIRLNGRCYLPKEDRNDKPLNLEIGDWTKVAQEWFDRNETEVHFDTEETDLLKFTAFVDAIEIPSDITEPAVEENESEIPEESPETEEGEEGEEGESSEKPEEKPEESEESEESEEPEEPEKPEEPKEKKELKEFEDALGL